MTLTADVARAHAEAEGLTLVPSPTKSGFKGVKTHFHPPVGKGSPPPVGKAGFDVWVLTKGGLVCLATCRPARTVGSHNPIVHAHLLGRYAQTSGARVYRYGPVTKCNPFLVLE